MPAPTIEQLRNLTHDDLCDTNCLSKWCFEVIAKTPGEGHDAQTVNALSEFLPRKAGYYHAFSVFNGLWGNGGMSHVLLNSDMETHVQFLAVVAEGFRYFGATKTADLIELLIPKAVEWAARNDEMNEREAPDEEFDAFFDEIDAYDEVYDTLSGTDGNPWQGLVDDIHRIPADYTEPA